MLNTANFRVRQLKHVHLLIGFLASAGVVAFLIVGHYNPYILLSLTCAPGTSEYSTPTTPPICLSASSIQLLQQYAAFQQVVAHSGAGSSATSAQDCPSNSIWNGKICANSAPVSMFGASGCPVGSEVVGSDCIPSQVAQYGEIPINPASAPPGTPTCTYNSYSLLSIICIPKGTAPAQPVCDPGYHYSNDLTRCVKDDTISSGGSGSSSSGGVTTKVCGDGSVVGLNAICPGTATSSSGSTSDNNAQQIASLQAQIAALQAQIALAKPGETPASQQQMQQDILTLTQQLAYMQQLQQQQNAQLAANANKNQLIELLKVPANDIIISIIIMFIFMFALILKPRPRR